MAGQAAAEAATLALAQSLDQGSRLSVQDYQHLLRRAAKPAEQQQLNAGAAANAPRLVVPQRGSATTPGLIERTLIQPGRKGVAVALSKAMQGNKNSRIRTLPRSVKYIGSDEGRADFLPSDAPLPLIGKFASSRTRSVKDSHRVAHKTHQVHKVRLVVPKPGTALQVNSIQPAGGSTATVHTAQPHAFSGATQLASLTGLPCELDGTYPVIASGKKKSRTQLEIELFKGQPSEKRAALEEEVQQAVGAGSVAVSENYMLDDSMEILYFRLADDAAEDAAAVGAAAEDDTAGAEPAAEPAVAAVAAQDAAAAPAAPMLLAGAVQPLPQGILVPVPLTDPELPNEELDAPAEWWLD